MKVWELCLAVHIFRASSVQCELGGSSCARKNTSTPVAGDAILMQFRRNVHAASLANGVRKNPLTRFCGIAANTEQNNDYNHEDLRDAAEVAGASKIWHYNWKMSTDVKHDGVLFVPMVKQPGHTMGMPVGDLPVANDDGRGDVVKGWNEPDDRGQAGSDERLRTNPEHYAKAWVDDMTVARNKGYKVFIGPAMAHDTQWLDYFLKGCLHTTGCKELITHLAFHRYRMDCATYEAKPDNAGWRDDLSYVLTYYRLMKKYNARGFNLQGLVWDELGCLENNGHPSDDALQLRYMQDWYANTIVKVKMGDATVTEQIIGTPWIMPRGPDALTTSQSYSPGMGGAEDGGEDAGSDAVRAIQSIISVAWFSIAPEKNHLFTLSGGLSDLGRVYFNACKNVISSSTSVEDPLPTLAPRQFSGAVYRLTAMDAGRVLYVDQNAGKVAAEPGKSGSESLWRMQASESGGYTFMNIGSGNFLYASASGDWSWGFGIRNEIGDASSTWNLQKQGGDLYRIVSEQSSRTLYAAVGQSGSDGIGAGSSVGSDGVWVLAEESEVASTSPSTSNPTSHSADPTTPAPSLSGSTIELTNVASGRSLYAEAGESVGAAAGNDLQQRLLDEQTSSVWIIRGQPETGYTISDILHGHVLYASNTADWGWGFGIGEASSHTADSLWVLKTEDNNNFRLEGKLSGRQLYAQRGKSGSSGLGAGSSVGSDGVWKAVTVLAETSLAPSPPEEVDGHEPVSLDGANVKFRNLISNRVLYCGGTGLGATEGLNDGSEVWTLTAVASNGYLIKCQATGEILYATSNSDWEWGFGVGPLADHSARDGVWDLVRGDHHLEFRIVSRAAQRTIYAQTGKDAGHGLGAGSSVGADGNWELTVTNKATQSSSTSVSTSVTMSPTTTVATSSSTSVATSPSTSTTPCESATGSSVVFDGAQLKFTNLASRRRLFSGESLVGASESGISSNQDVWTLRAVPGGYTIVSAATGKALFATEDGDWSWGFGGSHEETTGHQRFVWAFRSEPGAPDHAYRLVGGGSRRTLYAQHGKSADSGIGAGSSVGTDGVWIVELASTPVAEPDQEKETADNLDGQAIRLINIVSNRILYLNDGKVKACKEKDGSATIWRVTATPDGSTITNVESRRGLYATDSADWSAGFGADGDFENRNDAKWTFKHETGKLYRIVNSHSKRALYAQHGTSAEEGIGAGSAVGEDGMWLVDKV